MAARYTEVHFNTKLPLVPKSGVRYREVSSISVRYKEVNFYETLAVFTCVYVLLMYYPNLVFAEKPLYFHIF